VHRAAARGEFAEGNTQHRIVAADFDMRPDGRIPAAAIAAGTVVLQEALRLPRFQIIELVGKRLRIAGEFERFTGEDGRGDMMSVLARRLVRGKTGDDHVRLKRADDAHHVGKHLLVVPDAQRLAIILGIAKINRAGEKLLAAVQPARGQQFLGADDAQLLRRIPGRGHSGRRRRD
jgi:hypothetical protein